MTTTWKTRDGAVIEIAKMTDAHVTNTIRYLKRKYERELADSYGAAASFSPDSMASYYACGEADNVDMSPAYEPLLAEAERRRLQT